MRRQSAGPAAPAVGRLRKLPANQLPTRIAALQAQLQTQKAPQIAGSHNVVLVRTATGKDPDFTFTATYGVVQRWKAIFTPLDNTFDNLGLVWHVFWNFSTTVPNTTYDLEEEPGDPHTHYMSVMGTNPSATDTVGVTVVVYAIGSGTIAIEQIL